MRTHHDDGTPSNLEDLTATFGFRVRTLSDLAEFTARGCNRADVEALAQALSCIRDDWEQLNKALWDLYEREHPEENAEPEEQQATPTKGTTPCPS